MMWGILVKWTERHNQEIVFLSLLTWISYFDSLGEKSCWDELIRTCKSFIPTDKWVINTLLCAGHFPKSSDKHTSSFLEEVKLTGLVCLAENFTTVPPHLGFPAPKHTVSWDTINRRSTSHQQCHQAEHVWNLKTWFVLSFEDLICTVFLSYCQLNNHISI